MWRKLRDLQNVGSQNLIDLPILVAYVVWHVILSSFMISLMSLNTFTASRKLRPKNYTKYPSMIIT